MSEWRFIITSEAEKDLERLDRLLQQRIAQKLRWLIRNIDHLTPAPLSGPLKGLFKLRIGEWRVIYEPDYSENTVVVHIIDRRDKIYKRRG